MKKKIVTIAMVIVLFSTMGVYVFANQSERTAEEIKVLGHEEEILYADSKPLNKNPEPVLKGNTGIIPKSAYKATEASILDEKVLAERKGEVQLTDYMTYVEYLKFSGEESKSAEIADDRVVFVVQVYYPDGFEHVRAGFIENCLATGIYDAETGDYLGGSFETVKK